MQHDPGAPPAREASFAVRIWLPDEPGMLAEVSRVIASLDGDVAALEVLERRDGVAVDELMVGLPDARLSEELGRRLSAIPGTGVEEIRRVPAGTEERALQVVAAAVSILETANPSASLAALVGLLGDLFDADWSGVVDRRAGVLVQVTGEVPAFEQLLALADGAPGGTPGAPAGACAVAARELPDAGLFLCAGRTIPFRRRELRELEMLARVTDRMCRPLRADRVPPAWGPSSRSTGR